MSFCAKCGARLPVDDAAFCSKCGAATGKASVDILNSMSEALRAAGKEIEAGLKTAGEEIDKAFRDLRDEFFDRTGPYCVRCRSRNPNTARFCFSCGREIPHTT